MSTEGTLSIRAYARHRGVSDAAVRKALKKGKITAEPDGSIDPVRADEDWEANTREPVRTPRGGSRSGAHAEEGGSHPPSRQFRREMERAARSDETKAEAERRKEIALANIREREDAVGAGRLVDRQATASAWFAVCRTARDQMLAVRERIEVRLGLPTEQLDIITEEMRTVLHGLAKEVPGLGDRLPEAVDL